MIIFAYTLAAILIIFLGFTIQQFRFQWGFIHLVLLLSTGLLIVGYMIYPLSSFGKSNIENVVDTFFLAWKNNDPQQAREIINSDTGLEAMAELFSDYEARPKSWQLDLQNQNEAISGTILFSDNTTNQFSLLIAWDWLRFRWEINALLINSNRLIYGFGDSSSPITTILSSFQTFSYFAFTFGILAFLYSWYMLGKLTGPRAK